MTEIEYRVLESGTFQLKHPFYGWIDERKLSAEDRPWRPFLPATPWKPDGSPGTLDEGQTYWANGHYLVLRTDGVTDVGATAHLSLRTVENDTRHDWRELQRVKNEICGPEWEGVELYPAVSRTVDSANQYHLWCFETRLPIGFEERFVADEKLATLIGAKQRPLNGAHS